jgi:beta-glucanase (GH16 family)
MKTRKILPIAMALPVALMFACSTETLMPPVDETAEGAPESSAAILPGSSDALVQSSSDALIQSSDALVQSSSDALVASSSAVVPTSSASGSGNYVFYGAELSGTDQFKYGRFEARMKMVSIPGSVSSMFLYYDDSWRKEDEPWNEIDIEVLGKGGTMWQSNIITREADPSIKANTSSESKPLHEFGFDATQDFHLFAIVWTPEYVAWEIDSVEIRRDTLGMERGTHADKDQVAFLTENQSLRFNLWASKSVGWVGKFTGEELAAGPQEQVIDYVRVYAYDAATKGFTQLWQDDFEGTALSDHWNVGNWEMEKVELSPFNVVVEGGFCKLRLSREEE